MKTVFVVGTKNSGKTTLAEFIVLKLTERGFKVAALKHIHHEFTLDSAGKDTYRMKKAGAKEVVSFSPSEIAILRSPGDADEEFRRLSEGLTVDGFDYLVIEGFKILSGGISRSFRILTCKTMEELTSLVPTMLPNLDCISGIVASSFEGKDFDGVPVLRFPDDGLALISRLTGAQSGA